MLKKTWRMLKKFPAWFGTQIIKGGFCSWANKK